MVKYSLILALSILYVFQAKAQYYEKDDNGPITLKNFRSDLSGSKIQYTPPDGYEIAYKSYSAHLGNYSLTSSRHQLTAVKDSIFVYFTITEIDTSKVHLDRLKRYGFSKINVNRNFLSSRLDTLKHPIIHNSQPISSNKYNADQSGMYDLPLSRRYLDLYNYCKVMYIHKENQADVEIFFFYTDHSVPKLLQHIENVSKRVRFLP